MIGFFGGTFDPIHFGHLNLAVELMEAHHLDEVCFCPANVSPHKLGSDSVPTHHRMVMTELAIQDNPKFNLLDIESKREGPSYTVDTLSALIKMERQRSDPRQIYLLMSDETIPGFFHWNQPEEIVKLAPILVGSRLPFPSLLETGNPVIVEALKKGWTPTGRFDISSTRVRERLRKGLYCGHLVPYKVLDYIYRNQLYYSI